MLVAVAVFALRRGRLSYRALLFATFDPEVAAVSGVNVGAPTRC